MRRLTEEQIKDSIGKIDFEPLEIKLEDRKTKSATGDPKLSIEW